MSEQAQEKRAFRRPSLAESIIMAFALFVPVVLGNIVMGYNIILMLLIAGFIAGILSFRIGWRYKEMEGSVIKSLEKAMPCVFILFMIGAVVGSFIFAGSIPMLIYFGMKIINPQLLAFCAVIICAILSICTGSSWTSAGTAGIAIMGIAIGLDVPLMPVLGAVVCGAVIGDKMSPLSDTTNLAAMATGVYLYDHIRSMMWTTVPAVAIALVIYLINGLTNVPDNLTTSQSFLELVNSLDAIFNWNILLLLPFVIMIGGALMKYPAVPCMFFSAIVAVILGVFIQGFSFGDGLNCIMNGFKVTMAASSGFNPETAPATVTKLLQRGGLNSMFFTICIVFSAYSYTGIATSGGYFDVLIEWLSGKDSSRGRTVLIAVLCGIFLTIFGGISYVPIIMLGTLFKKAYLRHDLDLSCLSRTCEDTGTMFIACVPWASSGVYYHGIFGHSVMEFAPWIIIPFICPILAVIYGYTGFGMKKLPHEEAQRQLAEIEAAENAVI